MYWPWYLFFYSLWSIYTFLSKSIHNLNYSQRLKIHLRIQTEYYVVMCISGYKWFEFTTFSVHQPASFATTSRLVVATVSRVAILYWNPSISIDWNELHRCCIWRFNRVAMPSLTPIETRPGSVNESGCWGGVGIFNSAVNKSKI